MENRKYVKLILLILALLPGFFYPNQKILAYGYETHGFLTKEVVNLYNSNSENKISDDLIAFIIEGSRREDDLPRPINHFYDPVYDRGYVVDPAIDKAIFPFGEKSKEWAVKSSLQNSAQYRISAFVGSILTAIQKQKIEEINFDSDFAWQRALGLYSAGRKEEAMFALGHIIHLLEDMSVPDHTRDDAHIGDSPYEDYAGRYNLNSPDNNLKNLINKNKIPKFSSLEEYFNSLATYSNNNFYSKDTIGIQSGYSKPELDIYEIIGPDKFIMGKDERGSYKIAVQSIRNNSLIVNQNSITTEREEISYDYWSRLSPKAVEYSAGLINLFFEQAKTAKPLEEKNFLGQVVDSVSGLFASVWNGINNIFNNNKYTALEEISSNIKNTEELLVINSNPVSADIQQTEDIQNNNQSQKEAPKINSPKIENKIEYKNCEYIKGKNPSYKEIIINEVAWMGNEASANDEWIELKNLTDKEINIYGWQLLDKAEQIKIIFGENKTPTKIPAKGFLLLERTSDDSVPKIKADIIYTGALSNSSEGLRLFNNNCELVDEVLAGTKWPAGDASTRKTMERSADLSWHTYSGGDNNRVFGTPKAENSKSSTTTTENTKLTEKEKLVESKKEIIPKTSGSSSGSATPKKIYPNILISEIQIEGDSAKQEFVELYNPNDFSVILDEWYVQRKTKTASSFSTYAKADLFAGKVILAKEYFIIARVDSGILADVYVDSPLTEDNSLVLKNPNREVVDLVGFGNANDCEENCAFNPPKNKSIERKKWEGIYIDSNNNALDFLVKDCPSPKGVANCLIIEEENKEIVAPPAIPVISEVMAGNGTGKSDEEFIEIYNPTETAIDLTGYVLKRKSSIESEAEQTLVKDELFTGKTIASKSFFLITSPEYVGDKAPDIIYSSGTHLAQSDDVIILKKGEEIIDEISYSEIPNGKSWERGGYKDGSCILASGEGEFIGNGCGEKENINFFSIREIPKPQNSLSLAEPREKPIKPTNVVGAYNRNKVIADFSWDVQLGMEFLINQVGDDIYLTNLKTANNYSQIRLLEVGRDYDFEIMAVDKDGLASDPISVWLNADGFFTRGGFYKDGDGKNRIELHYINKPAIPNIFKDENTWGMLEINLKRTGELLQPIYNSCSGGGGAYKQLIFPDSRDYCNNSGGAYSDSYSDFEDNYFSAFIEGDFTSEDCLIISAYDHESTMPSDGRVPYFGLVAKDKTEYCFGSRPITKAPVLTGDLIINFQEGDFSLGISWPEATDEDTLDTSIKYEIKLKEVDEWISIGGKKNYKKYISPNEHFDIKVRAIDLDGNYSNELTGDFTAPIVSWQLAQDQQNIYSQNFGYLTGNERFMSAFQNIISPNDLSFNKVLLRIKRQSGGDSAWFRLKIVSDNNGSPNMANILGESIIGPRSPDGEDVIFSFSSLINFVSGNKYWMILDVSNYDSSWYNACHSNSWTIGVNNGNLLPNAESGTINDLMGITFSPNEDWYFKLGE